MWLASDFDLVGTDGSLDIGYVPLPVAQNGRRSYQAATGYFISAETGLVQPCWEWINFLVEQPMIGERNFTIPALRAAAESTVYHQAVGEERAAANLNTVSENLQPPLLRRFSGENSWLSVAYWWIADTYEQVLIEGMSAADALANAQEKADAYRECLVVNNNFAVAVQETCLRQVDEALALFLYGSNDE